MIRRCAIALLFALFGIASLLLSNFVNARFCELFPAIQQCRARGQQCGLDCAQSWALFEQIKAFLFFFGPSIAFAITAFIFAKRPRHAFTWIVFVVGLVAVHLAVVLFGLFLTAE